MVAGGPESRVPLPTPRPFLELSLPQMSCQDPDRTSFRRLARKRAGGLKVSPPPARVAGTQRPPPLHRMEGAPERSKVAWRGAGHRRGKKFAHSNRLSRPWDSPVAGTHTTLQPLQFREDNLRFLPPAVEAEGDSGRPSPLPITALGVLEEWELNPRAGSALRATYGSSPAPAQVSEPPSPSPPGWAPST